MLYKLLRQRKEQRPSSSSRYDLDEVLDCEALYKGGQEFESRLGRFVPQPDLMSAKTYSTVKNQARIRYVNLFSGVVNYYTAFLFSHPLLFNSSTEDPFYARLKDDCDGNGLDLQDLIENASTESLAAGKCAVVATLRELPYAPQNAAEAESMGAGDVTLRCYGAREIYDYERDSKGKLQWIILGDQHYPRTSPAEDGSTRVERYWVHTTTETQYYEIICERGQSPNPEEDISPASVTAHGYGRCPVELLEFPAGKWLGKQLLNPCIANLQARTALGFHNLKTAFPILVANIEESEKGLDEAIGDLGVKLGREDGLSFLVPPGTSRESLENQVRDTEAKVYRVGNLDFLIESEKNHSWRSAAAKLLDTSSGHISLKDYGSSIRDFAQRILTMVSQVRGDSDLTWKVSGFEKLDDLNFEQLTSIIKRVCETDYSRLAVFGESFSKELLKRTSALALPDLSEETKKAIEAEIDSLNLEDFASEEDAETKSELPSDNQVATELPN